MKKLLTILLSVLCLFSVVGINVSAASVETVAIEKIDVYGVEAGAKNTLSAFGGLKYNCTYNKEATEKDGQKGLVIDECTCFYLYADKFEKVKDREELSNYIVHDNTLEYGTKYYFVVSLLPNTDGGFVASDNIEVDINVNGKDTPIKASPISSLIENGEKKKADISSLTDKKQSRIMFYIPFETISDQKSVTLNYSVGEEYEWTITNKMGTDVNTKDIWVGEHFDKEPTADTLVNVEVTRLNINPTNLLTITVDSENAADDDIYKMVTTEGREASYKITGTLADEAEEWLDDNKTVVLKTNNYIDGPANAVKASGVFSWLDGAPKLAGLYQDTLTFTAEIKEINIPKKGQLITIEGDNNKYQYRVLSTDGTNAELFVADGSNRDYYENVCWGTDETEEFSNGKEYLKYECDESKVKQLCDEFYVDDLCQDIKDRIIPQDVVRHSVIIYDQEDLDFDNADYKIIDDSEGPLRSIKILGQKEEKNQLVYPLDIVDLYEYYERNELYTKDLKELALVDTDDGKKGITLFTVGNEYDDLEGGLVSGNYAISFFPLYIPDIYDFVVLDANIDVNSASANCFAAAFVVDMTDLKYNVVPE